MKNCNSCQRCGRCCTQFGVCVTPFDVARISKATGMQPEEFLDLVPDHKEREREEPAILINHEFFLLVLKRQVGDVCCFYTGKGCKIYENRPSLCKAYPFTLKTQDQSNGEPFDGPQNEDVLSDSKLSELRSRSCIRPWDPQGNEKEQYVADCIQYKKEVKEYRGIAEQWNRKGGSFKEFLNFVASASG